ncbi:MAG: DUF3667 domain-containing protein [Parvularculaceae bacterium]
MGELEGPDGVEGGEENVGEETAPASETEPASDDGVVTPTRVCVSCGAIAPGVFCAVCGQKNDDMRRSSVVLASDFLRDTFGFDSRMWRTLGLMAIAPGLVPSNYAHGKRSRFTPPVRLFLVISFLFFLTLAATKTMFVAIEIQPLTAEDAELVKVADLALEHARDGGADVAEAPPACKINASLAFFKRPSDVNTDHEAFEACLEKVRKRTTSKLEERDSDATDRGDDERTLAILDKLAGGVSDAIRNPDQFNAAFNNWLPRVLFFMTPVLALLLALFIRGRDALLFDHMVLSLYSHAAAFVIVGAGVVAGQFGAPIAGPAASVALVAYFIVAVRRAYGRSWLKTIPSSLIVALIYVTILLAIVATIVFNMVWTNG